MSSAFVSVCVSRFSSIVSDSSVVRKLADCGTNTAAEIAVFFCGVSVTRIVVSLGEQLIVIFVFVVVVEIFGVG